MLAYFATAAFISGGTSYYVYIQLVDKPLPAMLEGKYSMMSSSNK